MNLSENFKKYNWIDFGRGIAVLLVIMIHVGQNFSNEEFLNNFTQTGTMGVQLFFILSSFTLFYSYTNRYEIDGKERIKYFFIRRFFRIAPLYYFFAVFYTFFQIALKGIHTIEYWKVLMSVLFLNGLFVPVINYIPPGGWSIGTEMLFYCTIPFLFKKIKTIKHSVILLIIAILSSNLINYILKDFYIYHWLPNQFPVFCFGILLFFILKSIYFSNFFKSFFLITSILLFISLSQINSFFHSFCYSLQLPYIYSVVFCLFLIGIKDYEFNSKSGSFFRSIGKYSFSIYLLHFFILRVFLILFSFTGLKKNEMIFLISYLLVTAITFYLSSKLYVFEKKGIAFGNSQIEKIKQKIKK